MKRALVLGGTRFFGKRLVQKLLERGYEVTVGSRGQAADPFGDQVRRLVLDRYDRESLAKAVGEETYDVVFDQICYASADAQDAVEVFKGKVGRYVFTSTLSVYDMAERALKEEDFDPYAYPVTIGPRSEFSYKEGKRLAEAVFFQQAEFPVVAVRFPVVLGTDDYTERLMFHIRHVREGQPIGAANLQAEQCFISSEEAAEFLAWVAESELTGPVNACATGEITLNHLLAIVEEEVGKRAIVREETEEKDQSPYNLPASWYMDNSRAREAGFAFSHLDEWLQGLIHELAAVK
jgi:nucleoside-diphosphate-sugar epimerase